MNGRRGVEGCGTNIQGHDIKSKDAHYHSTVLLGLRRGNTGCSTAARIIYSCPKFLVDTLLRLYWYKSHSMEATGHNVYVVYCRARALSYYSCHFDYGWPLHLVPSVAVKSLIYVVWTFVSCPIFCKATLVGMYMRRISLLLANGLGTRPHVVSCVTKEPKFLPMMTCQLGSHRASKCFLIFSAAASPIGATKGVLRILSSRWLETTSHLL